MKITETTKPTNRTFILEVNEDELKFIWYWATTPGAIDPFSAVGRVATRLNNKIKAILPDIRYNPVLSKCFNDD